MCFSCVRGELKGTYVYFDEDAQPGVLDIFLLLLRPLEGLVVPCQTWRNLVKRAAFRRACVLAPTFHDGVARDFFEETSFLVCIEVEV